MNIKEANEKFEQWRKEQIASLIRTGHLEAAKAFERLGSIHWMAWQCAWQASRESLVIELPTVCASDDPFVLKRDIADEIHAAGVKTK